MPDTDMDAIIAEEIEQAKRKACSLDGYRFIAEQLAALAGKPVLMMDLEPIVAQAQFALQCEQEFRLDALCESSECAPDTQQSGAQDHGMGQSQAVDVPEASVRDLPGEGAGQTRSILSAMRSALFKVS